MDGWMDGWGGHLGHGDLHGLQHLLHRLHGALVLLGAVTSLLRVGQEGEKKRIGITESSTEELKDHHVSFKPGQPNCTYVKKKNILSKLEETEPEWLLGGVALIGRFFLDRCLCDILIVGARAPRRGSPHERATSSAWST